jgi:hypothetical protein
MPSRKGFWATKQFDAIRKWDPSELPELAEREDLQKGNSAPSFQIHSQGNSLGDRRVPSIRYEHSTRGCASSSETLDRARKTNWNLSLIFILSIARLLRAVIDCVQTSDFVLVLA